MVTPPLILLMLLPPSAIPRGHRYTYALRRRRGARRAKAPPVRRDSAAAGERRRNKRVRRLILVSRASMVHVAPAIRQRNIFTAQKWRNVVHARHAVTAAAVGAPAARAFNHPNVLRASGALLLLPPYAICLRTARMHAAATTHTLPRASALRAIIQAKSAARAQHKDAAPRYITGAHTAPAIEAAYTPCRCDARAPAAAARVDAAIWRAAQPAPLLAIHARRASANAQRRHGQARRKDATAFILCALRAREARRPAKRALRNPSEPFCGDAAQAYAPLR